MTNYGAIPKGGKAIVPKFVLQDPELSAQCKALYSALCRHANKNGFCWPSRANLAKQMGCNPRTVQGWVQALKRAGYIYATFRKDGRYSGYVVIRDPDGIEFAKRKYAEEWIRFASAPKETKLPPQGDTNVSTPGETGLPPKQHQQNTPTKTEIGDHTDEPDKRQAQPLLFRGVSDANAREQKRINEIVDRLGGWRVVAKLSEEEQRQFGLVT